MDFFLHSGRDEALRRCQGMLQNGDIKVVFEKEKRTQVLPDLVECTLSTPVASGSFISLSVN